jgi:predicted acylesterase/phospholipase RssA
MFKHLVIAGGGSLTLKILGTLQYMLEKSIIEYDNVETIYATSAGALIGVGFALKMDIRLITNYVINRPWEDIWQITPSHVYNLYSKKGIFDKSCIVKFMQPLLDYKAIDINITLADFFILTNIELHMFAIELNDMTTVDISYKTFPELSLLDALCMTSCLPVAFEPFVYKDTLYIDAGIIANYPLSYCIKNVGTDKLEEILGFEISCNTKKIDDCDIITYFSLLVHKLFQKINDNDTYEIPNKITYHTIESTFSSLIESFSSEKREDYINEGMDYGEKFLPNLQAEN